jgi:hypothetical protein
MPAELAGEISGCADVIWSNSPNAYAWMTFLNIGYELSDLCTSIVAQSSDGTIIHARNMDFAIGGPFTDALRSVAIDLNVTRGGVTQFYATGFVGYVGVLSGQRPGAFSVTIDTRFYPKGPLQLLWEVILGKWTLNPYRIESLSFELCKNEKLTI